MICFNIGGERVRSKISTIKLSRFFCLLNFAALKKVIIWSCDIERKLEVKAFTIIGKLHPSCWNVGMYESEIETLVGFRKVINNMKVVIPGYVVERFGFPFIFGN